ncbi:SIR2 family protein [[Clostridium] innocuum]|nr:SIR2 family protein [[Clostridium] innocuum]MCR0576786.1 SIR2 family protein [[Clostridium] innocuum]
MYSNVKLDFLSKQSCSNFYKLMRELNDHQCCLALGAGASATVGLPTWALLLKKICHCYFSQWALEISTGKSTMERPTMNTSIALTNSYDMYMLEKAQPELSELIEKSFDDIEYWENGRKLSDEECLNKNKTMRKIFQNIHQTQDDFMEKIMSGDLTIIAQMIKNQVCSRDWNYLIRKSLYASYEDTPFILKVSPLYDELIYLVKKYAITNIINYNYDDTFYHSLKDRGIKYKNLYENCKMIGNKYIFYPHGYIPMKGGVITDTVLSEDDYQNQIYRQNLWSNNIQTSLFATSSVIFIGLSLNDANIRRIINMCSNASRYKHYAFLPYSGQSQASLMYDSLCDSDLYRLGIRVIRYAPTNNHELLPFLVHSLHM